MKSILNEINISYKEQETKFKGVRPDFFIEDFKLIIECDGLRYHSDLFKKDDYYHFNKKQKYDNFGYNSLFFRSNELYNKRQIVESIINNNLKLNKKLGARQTTAHKIVDSSDFLSKNHLMGKGSGRSYVLKYNEEIVACCQVKWKNKKEKQLEVSRFCSKNNLTVTGGFDKLINFVIKAELPHSIITFIDRRYGTGEYLKNLGWKMSNEDISFMWTDSKDTYHRLNFSGNSGYEKNLFKIWDCGQRKFVKTIVE